jgi:threonine/homoserine/homoserine lactone efflux protein
VSFLAFLVAAVILAVTPGPGIAYVVARTVAGGRSEGLASCFGTGMGGMLHVLAAALGLSLIVAQSAVAFSVVKYLGAAYLIYLGLRLLLRRDDAFKIDRVASQGARRALVEGVLVEALNVKTALFFLAFLPQFVAPGKPLVPQLVLLGSICVTLNTLVDVVAVFAADRLLQSGPALDSVTDWRNDFPQQACGSPWHPETPNAMMRSSVAFGTPTLECVPMAATRPARLR